MNIAGAAGIMIRFFAVLMVAAWAGPAAAETPGSVLYPEDRTVVGGTVKVVVDADDQRLPGPLFQVTVGGKSGPIVNARAMHVVPGGVNLAPGENRITVTFFRQSALTGRMKPAATRVLTVFSEREFSGPDVPNGFRRQSFHRGGDVEACQRCHNGSTGASGKIAAGSPGATCASCHSFVASRQNVHGPVAAGACTACHSAAGGDAQIIPAAFRPSVTAPGQTPLCGRCHTAMLTQKFTHGPVAAGLCTACHDPHTSQYQARLRQPVNELCRQCHEHRVLSTCAAKVSAASGGPVTCTVCHDPHGAENQNLLVVKAVIP